jgi:hypothetical protein
VAENYAFYSHTYDALPEENLRQLGSDCKFTVTGGADSRTFVFQWPNVTVTCNEKPRKELPNHLDGFCGYVKHIYRRKLDSRGEDILDRIQYTRLVVGVVVEPGCDREGRAERVLGALANGLDALLFCQSALYDKNSKLILAPDGSFDPEADVLGPVAKVTEKRIQVELPKDQACQPTADQQARYERVQKELATHQVPTLSYALHVGSEQGTILRKPDEVARRVLVLNAVTYLADGGKRKDALARIDKMELWNDVSEEEKEFLEAKKTDEELARKLLWRLEGLWVLVWALGGVKLEWPSGFCDVPQLSRVIEDHASDPKFIRTAKLRSKKEILDALQLTLLQHWAVRDAFVHDREIPADLDWSGDADMVPVTQSVAGGVVAERHHALNWLTRFDDASWDDTDTST